MANRHRNRGQCALVGIAPAEPGEQAMKPRKGSAVFDCEHCGREVFVGVGASNLCNDCLGVTQDERTDAVLARIKEENKP